MIAATKMQATHALNIWLCTVDVHASMSAGTTSTLHAQLGPKDLQDTDAITQLWQLHNVVSCMV
jgi:hypothetical protein